MTIKRTKLAPKAKAAPKPKREGIFCAGCDNPIDPQKAPYQIPSFWPEIAPTEYCCSRKCFDTWSRANPARRSKDWEKYV